MTNVAINSQPFNNGAQLTTGATYTFAANATSDTRKVEFRRDGEIEDVGRSVPYQYTWKPLGPGPHTMDFIAINASGIRGAPYTVSFTVNWPAGSYTVNNSQSLSKYFTIHTAW